MDELGLAEGLYEDYLLQDLMTFTYAAKDLRAGYVGDDVVWNRKRAESFRRMGLVEAASVFQDYVDLVAHVSENETDFPELATEHLVGLQPELDKLHNRMVAAAKETPRDVMGPAAIKAYGIELQPHKDAISYWIDLATNSDSSRKLRAAAKSDEMFELQFSYEQASALQKKGVEWGFYLFEFQSGGKQSSTRQLWQTNMGVLATPYSPKQHDIADVDVWPSGQHFTSGPGSQTRNGSKIATKAAEHTHIVEFTAASERISNISTTGPLARLQNIPVIGSLLHIAVLSFNPRANFRFFRGLAQQGVKSGLIVRHLGRAALWTALLYILSTSGVAHTILGDVIASEGSWSDIAFVFGVMIGVALWCQAVPTTLGLIVGSFDRRSGRIKWNSRLPNTGHENFITRTGTNS